MYQLNNLKRNVLVMCDEVWFHAATSSVVNNRQILQAIIIAEERFIRPVICNELYEDFRVQKNLTIDADNIDTQKAVTGIQNLKIGDVVNAIEYVNNEWYKKLWYEYLWKICAECVIYVATPTNASEFTAQGEMIAQPKGPLFDGQAVQSADIKQINWKMDKMLFERIDVLLKSMHTWLCKNIAHFPKYKCKPCECSEAGMAAQSVRQSSWIFVYEETDKKKCNCHD